MIIIYKRVEETRELRLDDEWVNLIRIAKKMGLSPEKVRNFIQQKSDKAAKN